MQISLADLVRDLRGVRLAKSQTVSDWSSRPFSPRQIEYLVDDVAHLLPMRDDVGRALEDGRALRLGDGRVRRAGRRWRAIAWTNAAHILRIPGATRMSRRELAILNEIVKLRDGVARDRDVPPKYIIPDDVVGGLATLRPKRVEEFESVAPPGCRRAPPTRRCNYTRCRPCRGTRRIGAAGTAQASVGPGTRHVSRADGGRRRRDRPAPRRPGKSTRAAQRSRTDRARSSARPRIARDLARATAVASGAAGRSPLAAALRRSFDDGRRLRRRKSQNTLHP